MTKAKRIKDLAVLVRRGYDGYVFSEVRDRNALEPKRYLGSAIVIDRQRGRQLDSESVISRAQTLAELLNLPYDEDLTQQCGSDMGFIHCNCPRCVAKKDARAKKTNA